MKSATGIQIGVKILPFSKLGECFRLPDAGFFVCWKPDLYRNVYKQLIGIVLIAVAIRRLHGFCRIIIAKPDCRYPTPFLRSWIVPAERNASVHHWATEKLLRWSRCGLCRQQIFFPLFFRGWCLTDPLHLDNGITSYSYSSPLHLGYFPQMPQILQIADFAEPINQLLIN